MQYRPPSAKRRSALAFATAVIATGCTSILGIDGEYARDHATGTGSGGRDTGTAGTAGRPSGGARADSGPGESGGRRTGTGGGGGGEAASGGDTDAAAGGSMAGAVGSGGITAGGAAGASGGKASGGETSGGAAGAASGGAGGVSQPEDAGPPPCPSGTYQGTYAGTDRPSIAATTVSAPIGGDITLKFTASGAHTATVSGTFINTLQVTEGGIDGSLHGTFDCAAGTGTATLSNCMVSTLIPTFRGPIDGSMDMTIDDKGLVRGSFAIHEQLVPAAMGGGTWSAKHTGN